MSEAMSKVINDLTRKIHSLEAINAELKRDAERYRWLRVHLDDDKDHGLMEHKRGSEYGFKQQDSLDAAIDKAISNG